MPRGYDYNLVVIGGGSAGLTAARLASSLGARVALVEKKKLGGDCLHTGCVPSKALLKTASIYALRNRAEEFGLTSISMEMDFGQVMARIKRVITQMEPKVSVERLLTQGISYYEGGAKILSAREVAVSGKLLRTRAILIATGARPALPEINGLADMNPLTSDTIWELEKLPKRLLVLGGGVIGCELAQGFQRLGSEVTLVERNERILPREDLDVSHNLSRQFSSEGMKLILSAGTMKFSRDGKTKILECESGARAEFDEVLVALGRKPNVEGLGLEDVGVRLRNGGNIETDLSFRTSVKGIYACGDVSGPLQFNHFATMSAEIATRNALYAPFRREKAKLEVFPWAIFTDPEIARVGWSETEARARGLSYSVKQVDFGGVDRAHTEEARNGFVKILVAPRTGKILGATVVGAQAGELIQEFALAMKHGIGFAGVRDTTHAYPTLVEANKIAAGTSGGRGSPWFARTRAWHRLWRNLP